MSNKIRFDAELNDGVSKKLNGISKSFDKLGGPGSGASLFGNVVAKGVAVGFGLIASAADRAVGFLFDSVDAFSKLEQSAGAVDAVFGKSSAAIEAFAATADESAGLSKRAVFEMAAVIGASLQGMGLSAEDAAEKTVELEKIGADLAATFGGPTTDAVNAIGSALRGERDPIERFGISIKEADVQARILALGLDTTTTANKKLAVATATLTLIQDGAKLSTGAFARETDTLAGKQAIANAKMENAQAILGEKLIPLQMKFTDFMIDTGIPALISIAEGAERAARGFLWWGDQLWRVLGMTKELVKVNKHVGGPAALKAALNANANGGLGAQAFAEGGMVQGPVGSPQMAIVHGGEQVLTPAQQRSGASSGGYTIVGVSARDIARVVDEQLFVQLRRAAPTSGRV